MPSLLFEAVIFLGPLAILAFFLDYKMNSYCSDISINDLSIKSSNSTVNSNQTFSFKKPNTNSNIIHIITGGSGFIGSWIARYLLIRGDSNIYVVDCNPLPKDLQRHGINYLNIDLIDNSSDKEKFHNFLAENYKDNEIVIFHCAVTAMYNPRKRATRIDVPKDNIKIANTLIDCCLPFKNNISIINLGDAMCLRKNVQWYNPFAIKSWQNVAKDTSNRKKSSYVNEYAYSKAESERIILDSGIKSLSLRPQGFVTGHLGDSFLTPALQYNGGLLHSSGIPFNLIHVEDVAALCLLLEKKLIEEKIQNYRIYTISSLEMTNLFSTYNYISARRPFSKIKIQPVIVLTVSHIIALNNGLRKLITRKPVGTTPKEDALLCGGAISLTPARFNVLQTTQLPLSEDIKVLESEVYGFKLKYSIQDILDGILQEERAINEKMKYNKRK